MNSLEDMLATTLRSFAEWVARDGWYGRENEAISAYVMGFLAPACCGAGALRSPTQIGIEVAVQQLQGPDRKLLVRKDLVLWAEPFMTVWGSGRKPEHHPMCILEWKRHGFSAREDREWLHQFAQHAPPSFLGFSVVFAPDSTRGVVRVARVSATTIEDDWLVAP